MTKVGNLTLYLVILNSIIGGGLFVNLSTFNETLGSFGPMLYFLGYLIFFPIIFCVGSLAQGQKEEGGLFLLAKKELGVSLGFLSCWTYFLGRSVSAGLLIRLLSIGLINNFPIFLPLSATGLSIILVVLMSLINILGLSNTGFMQKVFSSLKLFPIFILLILGIMFFNWQNFNFESDSLLMFKNLKSSIPSAVYALQGFTIVIHIGHLIKSPENLLKILLIATLTVALLCFSFQAVVFASIGKIATTNTMATFVSHVGVENPFFKLLLNNIINIAYLSSSFMILTGNSWNLFALAKNGFIPGKELLLTQINNAPAYCLALHSLVSIGFIVVCQNILALQAASVFAAFCTYFLCSFAAFKNFLKQKSLFSIIGLLAIINCLFILYSSLKLIIQFGLSYEFVILFLLGLAMLIWKFFSKNTGNENISLN